jgi:hypothetical protein
MSCTFIAFKYINALFYFRDDAVFFSLFFELSTLGSITTKQGFGAIFGVFSTKCFKFYPYLPIAHFVLLAKDGRTAYKPPG